MRAVPLLQPIRETVQVLFGRSLRARFARAAFWSTGGSVSAQLGAFVSTIVCARILGPVDFGKLGIVRSTVLMFGTFAGLGLGAAASKYVADYRPTNPQRAARVIALFPLTS